MPRSATDSKWLRTCPVCSGQFQQMRPKTIYCSRACAEQERMKWARPVGGTKADASLGPRVCAVCGVEYQPTRVSQLACSRACRDKLPEQRERIRALDKSPERRARSNLVRRSNLKRAEAQRRYNRKQQLAKYGLTVDDYDRMLAGQGGVCWLCGRPPKTDGVRAASKLHADHDHETGLARALLCLNCNHGLGCFHDDPALLRKAAEYIERHRALVAEGKEDG